MLFFKTKKYVFFLTQKFIVLLGLVSLIFVFSFKEINVTSNDILVYVTNLATAEIFTPAICGNGVKEGAEVCDGAAGCAAPNTCNFSCTACNLLKVKPLAIIISGLIKWLLTLAASLAILFLIIGGIRYINLRGDFEQIEKAKNIITFVVIGLVIILIAYSVIVALDKIIKG